VICDAPNSTFGTLVRPTALTPPPPSSPLHRWALQYHFVNENECVGDEAMRLRLFGEEGKGASC
jgi:hypothetical protein